MTKYMPKKPMTLGFDEGAMPGDVFDIKKLKHPVVMGGKKHKYIEVNTQHFMSKKFIKDNFTKGTYKSDAPKRILKTLLIIAVYELSKYVTNEIITRRQANDAVDQYPMDYEVSV
ncbi:hypothetical protein AST00_10700 [Staphylococcus equorum]|uniref:transcriptional activator RinB n=1 Tax=Staphylococcus equorum TaxID=246432 RepID=UPI00085304E9|nr:hypothetical protein [Staphylococcus equorum]OEK64373.1 hypothetical protein AST00_10700 [Staphylococcus equorum]